MAKYSEDTLNNWRMPPSDTEEQKLENAQKMVKEAIQADETLSKMTIEVFGQGSYANDTNVKLNSDIDINVRYMDIFYFELPANKSRSDFSLNNPVNSYTFSDFKNAVEKALVNKFGRTSVTRNDKCITIEANSYRVEADVVPTFNYRRYSENGSYVEGTEFMSDSYKWIKNFPLQHIANGKSKNYNTLKRFKRLTRIFRRVRYKMIDDNINVSDNITSFLLECLVWNIPDSIFNDYSTWSDRLKQSIIFLYNATKDSDYCKNWTEVSGLIYLFHSERKWSSQDVNLYLVDMWGFLELDK